MKVKPRIDEILAAKLHAPAVENVPTDVVDANEIVSARTETAKVYDIGGGLRRAIVKTSPVHFRDTDGKLKTIDMSVKRKCTLADKSHGEFETVSGLYKAHYPADKPWNYRLEMGDSWVEYEAQFEESKSLDISVETLRTGIKETITLFDADAPTRLTWNVSKSGTGITMLPPTAVDATGKDVPVTVTEGKGTLTYDVDVTGVTWPVVVDPTSVTATNDGRIFAYNATYLTARNATSGGGVNSTLGAGQWNDSGTRIVYRSFMSFAIPAYARDEHALSVSMFLEGNWDGSATDFDMYVVEATYTDPAAVDNFNDFDGWAASGTYTGTVLNDTWNSASYSATWNEVEFNSSGISVVDEAGSTTLKLALLSSRDYTSTDPSSTETEYVLFEGSATADKEPYLSITIGVPSTGASGARTLTFASGMTIS